jgi:hypothetical protein
MPADYAWPPRTLGTAPQTPPQSAPAAAKTNSEAYRKPRSSDELRSVLPAADACLDKLTRSGVKFRVLDETHGISTPVKIESRIAGVRYFANGNTPLICDCRLALALVEVGPQLSAIGVDELRFSGAYVYRLSRVGRLSLHAYGLALDVHEIKSRGRAFSVERDFVRGQGSCDAPLAMPNAFACRMRQSGLFRELLTPDDNADHHDHVHLGVAPLPEDMARVEAQGPVATPAPAPRKTKLSRPRSAAAKSRR